MTEFQIASAVKNYVTSHEGVTDFPASIEQIADEVDTMRIRLVQQLDRSSIGGLRRPFIGYTQRAQISLDDDGKAVIPRVMTLSNGRPAVAYAGGTDGKNPFKIVTGDNIDFALHDPVTHDAPTVWFGDGEIEIVGDEATENFLIIAIWEDPSALASYGYDDEASNYPLPAGEIDAIIGKTAESYLRHMYRIFPQANTQSDIPQGQNVQGR